MPITPGRPHSPTIHPRTRPEANEFAARNRGTGDWFRHDGKNVENAPPPAARVGAYPDKVQATAEKNKGTNKHHTVDLDIFAASKLCEASSFLVHVFGILGYP